MSLVLEPTVSTVFINDQSDLLDVGTPFYQDGQLQVRVYWKKTGTTDAIYYSLLSGKQSCSVLDIFLFVLIKELTIRICVIK